MHLEDTYALLRKIGWGLVILPPSPWISDLPPHRIITTQTHAVPWANVRYEVTALSNSAPEPQLLTAINIRK